MARKAGGNIDAIKDAAEKGAEMLRDGTDSKLKPAAAEAADRVVEALKANKSKLSLDGLKGQLTKENIRENGLLAGGAVVAADGARRAFKKDEDGKRHVGRGAVQLAAGAGMFAAGVLAKRNGLTKDDTPSRS